MIEGNDRTPTWVLKTLLFIGGIIIRFNLFRMKYLGWRYGDDDD